MTGVGHSSMAPGSRSRGSGSSSGLRVGTAMHVAVCAQVGRDAPRSGVAIPFGLRKTGELPRSPGTSAG